MTEFGLTLHAVLSMARGLKKIPVSCLPESSSAGAGKVAGFTMGWGYSMEGGVVSHQPYLIGQEFG